MVSETSLPINRESSRFVNQSGGFRRDFTQQKYLVKISHRALFLGGCDAYKALSLPPTVLDGLRHRTIQGQQYDVPPDLLLNVNIHRISVESQLSA